MVQPISALTSVVVPVFLNTTSIFCTPGEVDTGLGILTKAASFPFAASSNRTCGRVPVLVKVATGAAVVPLALAAALVRDVMVLHKKPVVVQLVGRINSVITSRLSVPFQVNVAVLKLNVSHPAVAGMVPFVV